MFNNMFMKNMLVVQVELESPRSSSDFSLVEVKEHKLEFNFIVKLATAKGRGDIEFKLLKA